MIGNLGRLLILASLLVAATGAVIGFAAGRSRSVDGTKWARRCAYIFALLTMGANFVMVYALLKHDFSVSYVAQVGSLSVPTWVTVVSLWSSLEGSILFWGGILGLYIGVAALFTRNQHPEYMADAIGIWLSVGAFFSFLIAGPANPFITLASPPLDGPGPNPLLQNHVLMAIHPPFLYLGYVGMAIPFGLATAALLRGRIGHSFLKPIRESLMLPWIFLTIAIMLGGWWAYEVLGWGGYWAWDPVENASLLPWLTGTAALHSLIVLERRGILKGWTITLIQATFLLVILGTFMTRSGVFNSVHSFTQSSIGPTILVFLTAALIFCVVSLAMKIDSLESEGRVEGPMTREGMFLVNNLLFVLLTFTVLIGTVFPLIVEAVAGKQMSVGRPYFDRMVVPVGVALIFLLGIGPALPWGRASKEQIRKALLPPIIGGLILLAISFVLGVRNAWTLATLFLGGYAAQVTLKEMWLPMMQRLRRGDTVGTAFVEGQLRRGHRRFAAFIVHAGMIIVIVAIAVSSTMRTSTEVQLVKGQSTTFAGYTLTLLGVDERTEPHRAATVARIAVLKNGTQVTLLEPKMNQYERMREPIGTPDVYTTAGGDLYLSLMNVDSNTQQVGLTIIQTPMIVWIWLSVLLMGLGGLFSLLPVARRNFVVAVQSKPASISEGDEVAVS
jgi:cytochrome c-type biogenesis protein CcmF